MMARAMKSPLPCSFSPQYSNKPSSASACCTNKSHTNNERHLETLMNMKPEHSLCGPVYGGTSARTPVNSRVPVLYSFPVNKGQQ